MRWNMPHLQKYSSLQDCLTDICSTGEDAVRPISDHEARQEAITWTRIEQAAAPGGVLHSIDFETPAVSQTKAVDPDAIFSHQDYLCAHIIMFEKALREEEKDHKRKAKERAYLALEKWKSMQPKTETDLMREQRIAFKSRVCKELSDKWAFMKGVASRHKIQEFQRQREERHKKGVEDTLDSLVKGQTEAIIRRKHKHGLTADSDPECRTTQAGAGLREYALASSETETGDGTDEDEEEDDNEDENEDDDNSESDSSTSSEESDQIADDGTGGLFGEELRKHIYGEDTAPVTPLDQDAVDSSQIPPDAPTSDRSRSASSSPGPGMNPLLPLLTDTATPTLAESTDFATVELEEVEDILMDDDDDVSDDADDDDDTDDDTEQDSEGGSSDDDISTDGEEAGGLLGFFSKSARRVVQDTPPTASTSVATDGHEVLPLSQVVPGTISKTSGVAEKPMPEQIVPRSSAVDDETEDVISAASLTPVSPLLRGTLRIYQHQGMDWLAGLYANGENGILADEMGLGKTIQTISLLAHLATEKRIWGPHLIIVPTSVLLNWEMEFKKFLPGFKILTYYGTQEERKAKRKGWTDSERWNVVITSYSTALVDAPSLKRKAWHYMVLDEAHNIKNFKSNRWQTLLHFNSHSRLLLTGTPLQNNLTELWSLLFFLDPSMDEEGGTKFKDLQTFASMFNKPAEQILDHGREGLDEQSRGVVKQLQLVLRPHLLRRLKADVEKQMPKKYEHIVKCRLSKRQRQLYDGYMNLGETREAFASSSYMSIIGCLMQLRKVCNHPDLFETRQIVTSLAMSKSAVADYEITELLVRKRMFDAEEAVTPKIDLLNLWRENTGTLTNSRSRKLAALQPLDVLSQILAVQVQNTAAGTYSSLDSCLEATVQRRSQSRLDYARFCCSQTAASMQMAPLYGAGLVQRYTFEQPPHVVNSQPKRHAALVDWCLSTSTVLKELFDLRLPYSIGTKLAIQKYGCITPAVVAQGIARQTLSSRGAALLRDRQPLEAPNPYHEAQTRLSIAFPDKSLIQYDCGKLQQLDWLLRERQSGGHRVLIFTQMTRVLDILEQFLNLHGHRYLRLDGSTRVESRQALTDQFNQDTRILAFILSSRSGGLGINLTGADTVIFYDLDWNPAMDKQCQDRCHRIGQTRDVHIYRFVCEGTIEANILRKSNQKRMLDDVVIQEGEFTTEAFYRSGAEEEIDAEADAALDIVLGGGSKTSIKAPQRIDGLLEQVEDEEDRNAARQAEKEEEVHTVDDFAEPATGQAEQTSAGEAVSTSTQPLTSTVAVEQVIEEEEEPGSYEDYMLRFLEYELRDMTVVWQTEEQRKRSKKGKNHAIIRITT